MIDGTTPEQLAALREEVRRTARATADLYRARLRPRLIRTGLGVAALGGLVGVIVRYPDYLLLLVFPHVMVIPLLPGIVGIVLFVDGIMKIASERRERRQRLVERLRALPGDHIATALLS